VDELASEALRDSLREQEWQRLVDRGLENGRKSGIREDLVVDVVHDWRNEQIRSDHEFLTTNFCFI